MSKGAGPKLRTADRAARESLRLKLSGPRSAIRKLDRSPSVAARLLRPVACLVVATLSLAGCRQDMHDQPRFEPFEKNPFFADMRSARPQVPGTVAQGQLREDEHFYTGLINGEPAETFPFPVTRETIERGRQRFEIFCAPCHGRLGDGQGIIARRGFRNPPSYHSNELRQAPPGHFFDVITNGFGAMYDFSDRIPPRDRWAIAAYIRALQLSQAAELEKLPAGLREEFQQSVTP